LPALRDFEGSFIIEWPFCFYGLLSVAATLRARHCATLKIAPGNFFYLLKIISLADQWLPLGLA